ncbi:MAG: ATP-binding cassette domain-containing protein [Anaerolineae bacterium]
MSILLRDLVKRYNDQMVVDHVDLEIADGELFVLLGPSGSGKSTVLRMIAGLTSVTSGHIILHSRDVTDLSPQQRDIGFVFQNYSLFRHMTVADNIEFGLAVRKVSKAERARRCDELLDLVGLGGLGQRYPSQLSGGQQQRVAVARALASQPSVLLLDEPFGALDVQIRVQLRQSLKEVQRRLGITTILVTHDQEEAFELADRIGIVDRGRLLEVGTPTQLYHRPNHQFVATFLGSANLLAGTQQGEEVRVGALKLSSNDPGTRFDAEGRAEVLFRPEDLVLAREGDHLDGAALGVGVVEEVLFLGTLQRVRVRLDPLPGTWPLPVRYGQEGVLLDVAVLSRPGGVEDVEPGQTVWVGIKHYHILPRPGFRLLLCTGDGAETDASTSLASWLGTAMGAEMTRMTIKPGVAVETLLRDIRSQEYDLVVVGGDRGETGGAYVERLARELTVPVLVVKSARASIKRVLLCSAGGEPGKIDVLFGARLARRVGASTRLLHVARSSPVHEAQAAGLEGGGQRPWLVRHLEEGRLTLLGQGVEVDTKIRQGGVVDEILAEAAESDYDLIVVGGHVPARQRAAAGHDVAGEIVARADRPVLVVRGRLA